MAAVKKAVAAKTAHDAWNNPYLRRFVEDQEVRDNVRVAYDSARNAYDRLNNRKSTGKQLLDDKKLHRELQTAADALRDASSSLRQGPKKKKKRKGGFGKLLLLAIVGGVGAVAASEGLRNKVLDALFGAEEEFDYTSTTQPTTPPPGGTAAASTTTASPNGS